MPCFLNDRSSSAETASSSPGTSRGSSSMSVTSLPNRRKIDANSTPTAPLPMIAIDFGISFRPIASSLVMMRLRSSSMPGTLRACEPVATMISLVAVSVCLSPSVISTLSLPASRPEPLIQSILFLRNSSSTPPVSDLTILSLRACTWPMSMRRSVASPIVSPHSFQFCATFNAWACSSSALVGMQPQFRQVPPSAGRALDHGGLQPELRGANGGDVAARCRTQSPRRRISSP